LNFDGIGPLSGFFKFSPHALNWNCFVQTRKILTVLDFPITNRAFWIEIVYFDGVQALDASNGALDFPILGRKGCPSVSSRTAWYRRCYVNYVHTPEALDCGEH
jgi:hypothetical protein